MVATRLPRASVMRWGVSHQLFLNAKVKPHKYKEGPCKPFMQIDTFFLFRLFLNIGRCPTPFYGNRVQTGRGMDINENLKGTK